MARFALAWELHGGADHLSPLARLARSLVERGHQVDFILRDLGVASPLGELMQHPPMWRCGRHRSGSSPRRHWASQRATAWTT